MLKLEGFRLLHKPEINTYINFFRQASGKELRNLWKGFYPLFWWDEKSTCVCRLGNCQIHYLKASGFHVDSDTEYDMAMPDAVYGIATNMEELDYSAIHTAFELAYAEYEAACKFEKAIRVSKGYDLEYTLIMNKEMREFSVQSKVGLGEYSEEFKLVSSSAVDALDTIIKLKGFSKEKAKKYGMGYSSGVATFELEYFGEKSEISFRVVEVKNVRAENDKAVCE